MGLDSLDFDVGPGEVVVVLGPNGAGKSSLLRVLATDLRPTSGSLVLFGESASGRVAGLRRKIAYAAETPVHFSALTGWENAHFFQTLVPTPARDSGIGISPAGAPDRIGELFRAFDLDDVRRTPVSEYSFGMSRKLLLLEALSTEPSLLLLDEPAVGLDLRALAALAEAVEGHATAGGSVILASNDLRTVPMWADRVLFLLRGRPVEDAPLSDLLDRLRGRTRIEFEFQDPVRDGRAQDSTLPTLRLEEIAGVERVHWRRAGVVLESSRGGAPLAAIAEALQSGRVGVRDVRIREPDLGDLFMGLTGEPLTATPEPRLDMPARSRAATS